MTAGLGKRLAMQPSSTASSMAAAIRRQIVWCAVPVGDIHLTEAEPRRDHVVTPGKAPHRCDHGSCCGTAVFPAVQPPVHANHVQAHAGDDRGDQLVGILVGHVDQDAAALRT